MAEKDKVMLDWINDKLSALLDFPVPEDLTKYILSIENARDLEEYLKTLLDFKNKQHEQFFSELLQKRQSGSTKSPDRDGIFIHSKTNEKRNSSKSRSQIDEVDQKESVKDAKKKPHFVSLYSPEGVTKDTILLKGRHRCDCQASKHKLINNCLTCGRIVCEQEGSGPCLVCSSLVCSREEQQLITAGTKRSDQLYQKLVDQKRPLGWEAALQQRNRLLEYDRTSQSRTKVIDDESDYYATNSVWLSKEERDKLKDREDNVRAKRYASRLDRKLTFDFAGRQVVEEAEDMQDICPADDNVLIEISQSLNRSTSVKLNDNNIHPGILCSQPIFQSVNNRTQPSGRKSRIEKKPESIIHRVQDRQFLEMSDGGLCLSMHQPWASLLTSGIKLHEGRTWYSSHRGRLWIAAASKVPNPTEIKVLEDQYKCLKDSSLVFPSEYPVGCLLGCVNVVDVLPQEEYRCKFPEGESDSPFVFICEDPQELPIRFPVQGQHKIYKLDPKLHQAAQKSLQRVAQLQAERSHHQ